MVFSSSSSSSSSSFSSSYLVLITDLVSRSNDASTAIAHRPTDRLRMLLLCPMCPSSHVFSGGNVSTVNVYTIEAPWKCRLTSPQHTRARNTIHWRTDAPVFFGSIAPSGPCIAHPPAARRRTRAPLRLPPSVRRASQPRLDAACIGTARADTFARADPAISIGSGWNHGSLIVQLIDSLIVYQYA